MKAIVCNKYCQPEDLELKDVPDPKISEDQILVQVKACSINFPDTLIIQGKYQFKGEFPFGPGSNIAGIVLEVGSSVMDFKAGDEVIGITTNGGLAEKIAIDPSRCIFKPSGVSMEQAAAFLYTYATSYYALKHRADLQEDETVLILGASGGVGLAAIEIAKMMGAKVIAAASSADKLSLCKKQGADICVNYSEGDLKSKLKELTDNKGVDVILDPVGGEYAEPSLRAIAWEGRYLVVGFASGQIPKFPLNLALLKGCQIVGVFLGAFLNKFPKESIDMLNTLADLFSKGKLNPYIYQSFNLEDAPKALRMMMDRKALGKLVIKVN